MKQVLIGLVRLYRLLLSPWVGGQCRFYPTCSQYTIEALQRHGAAGGTYLGAARILRCHPWCQGGHEPVPETFTWAPWRVRPGAGEPAALAEAMPASPLSMHNSGSTSAESVSPGESGAEAMAPERPASSLSAKP